jgi:hypothetical protein
MRRTDRSRRVLALLSAAVLLAGAFGSCATVVPNRLRPEGEAAVRSGLGAQMYVRLHNGDVIQGELIAISPQTVWVLGDGLVTIPTSSIQAATAGVFKTDQDAYVAWTVLGALSTLSHGVFLVFSLPVWLLAGFPMASYELRRGEVDGWATGVDSFRPYARFPQGMPAGLEAVDLRGIRPPRPAADAGAPLDASAPLDPARPPV